MVHSARVPWRLSMAFMVALTALTAHAAPPVNIGMEAAFPAAPYLLELIETAAQENSSAYFPLLDLVASGRFASTATDSELYTSFLEALKEEGHLKSPEALSTFKLALSLRSSSPRVESQHQYYVTTVLPAVLEQGGADCTNWILFEARQYCNVHFTKSAEGIPVSLPSKSLPFDRSIGSGPEAVLYADPLSTTFKEYHSVLYQAAQKGQLAYKLRYRPSEAVEKNPVPVSGYGVELALKRTDYIVIDDRDAAEADTQKPLASDVVLDGEEEVSDLKPLSTSELASLGLKASSFILQNDNPLDALVRLTQDFPKFSASIANHEVSKDFVKEHGQLRAQMIPGGINHIWMNGVQLIERQIQPLALIDMIRRERKLMKGVQDLGFSGKQAVSLLGHSKVAAVKSEDEPQRFDWTDRIEGGKTIIWLNDLEAQDGPKDLMALLQRGFPGQLPSIARNLFHLVIPVDLSNTEDVAMVIQLARTITLRAMPLRIGVVPLTDSTLSTEHVRVLYHLSEAYGGESLLTYLTGLTELLDGVAADELFDATVDAWQESLKSKDQKQSRAAVLESEVYTQRVEAAKKWAKRLNVDTDSSLFFIDGFGLSRDKSWMQNMFMKFQEDIQTVQRGLYHGIIGEDASIPEVLLENASARRNPFITPEDAKSIRILDVNKIYNEYTEVFNHIPVLQSYEDSSKENWAILTVVTDLSGVGGRDLLVSALEFKRNNPGIRVDIIHNPTDSAEALKLNEAMQKNPEKLIELETSNELETFIDGLARYASPIEDASFGMALSDWLSLAQLSSGDNALLLNGRIVGPLPASAIFTSDDFQQLLEFEQKNRILPVYEALEDLKLSDRVSSALAAAKITSITALSTISDLPEGIFESAPNVRMSLYENWNSTHSAIEVGNPETASIHIAGLLNPVSEQAQRWAPILRVLSELDGVYLKLFLNPKDVIEELPIKRFYRYVLESKPHFDDAGKVEGLNATFKGLPLEALLTIGMDLPPAWLVAPKASVHDLDNIKLGSLKSEVEALYELEHILIEGHSREGKGSTPPKGAQLVLATEKNPLITDTIIMANLGYFQFKTNPGVYTIQLKEGRSADIYDIESVGAHGWAAVAGDEGTDVALMGFQGTTLYPRLKRKPGMEYVDVLEAANEAEENIVAKGFKFAESILGGAAKTKSVSDQEHAEINIFSVASGHLYERMLNIMILSVMRNTKHTVKFWFIEQFLSPSFKDFIPYMAKEYGFKYEMVTFKWPHWLRQQKEKQREIWGYKILFLDVLFPLSLDKVIFVDADQIVRTDMMDLVRHDLEGAPYGFTPMCDSRTEMEGFRFWKQGYWANYLRGLPYHISALYVVDLRRFREIAAGDRLRQQYHSLSADPNSLSNLDQDLPNNMQFQIPIHSLPQEWLWCETWCSDESLADARTIDLCNNPQTKEPKLDRARRQVPEWTVYDDEIAALDRRRRGLEPEVSSSSSASHDPSQQDSGSSSEINTKSRSWEEPVHTRDEL